MTSFWASSTRQTPIVSWKISGNDWESLDWSYTQTRRAGSSSAGLPNKTGSERGEGKPETFDFLGFKHISGKNRLGRFTVRRKTIRKRIGAKLRELKQQLRKRMHDPVRQTGQWLKSIVQGYYHYYAVPGNTDSLSVFRDRLTGHWWHSLCRRSQQRRLSWTRMLALPDRWLPRPRVLHPYPADRFAANHPREEPDALPRNSRALNRFVTQPWVRWGQVRSPVVWLPV
jgi:hypothetical protein